jgi:hypothetical protein
MDDIKKLKKAWELLEESMSKPPKKLEEDGDCAATVAGDIAPFKQKIGKKPVKRMEEDLKSDAQGAAKQAIADAKSGHADQSDATIVGQLAKENEEVTPEADVDSEVAIDDSEETQDQEVADLITQLQSKFPGAEITISVKSADPEQPLPAELVAAAEELTQAPEDDTQVDMTDMTSPEELKENYTVKKKLARNKIKKIYESIAGDEDIAADEAPEGETEDVPEMPTGDDDQEPVAPTSVVTDTEITLTPEQWEHVMTTSDIVDVDAPTDDAPVDVNNGLDQVPTDTKETV